MLAKKCLIRLFAFNAEQFGPKKWHALRKPQILRGFVHFWRINYNVSVNVEKTDDLRCISP